MPLPPPDSSELKPHPAPTAIAVRTLIPTAMVRFLTEQGLQAESFDTEYGDDVVEADAAAATGAEPAP